MITRVCELCNAEAAVFCPSDAAFLCRSCDADVHEANFLVARHIRQPLCSAAAADDLDSLSSSSSSARISTNTSPAKEHSGGSRGFDSSSSIASGETRWPVKPRVDYFKAEGIFVNWCGKLGLGADVAVRTASSVLRACLEQRPLLPFRVCLAASLWLALRLKTRQILKRLEEISGVPAKLILVAESKLERALRAARQQSQLRAELEEGWAEC